MSLQNILFIDIETVPIASEYIGLSETAKQLWDKKSQWYNGAEELTSAEWYQKRAGVMAEFSKVVCIGYGAFGHQNGKDVFKVGAIEGHDEEALLQEFSYLMTNTLKKYTLCAHNGKEFDFPFLCRRMLINQVPFPPQLNIQGKKPWEVDLLDTLEMWKFGDRKNFTSLELLCHVFDIPTPKDDISGADVARVYHQENNLDRIVEYCKKDVVSLARLYQKWKTGSCIADEQVIRE